MSRSEKYYYFISVSIVSILFIILYYYSFKYIVNSWTFSTAHLNYSTGIVRRGLFGEIMNFFNTNLNIKNEIFFATYYCFFTTINLFIFCFLLRKLIKIKYIFIFFLFNPALILFQIYDPFAYQRGETTIITLMLLHTVLVNWFLDNKISKKNYTNFYLFVLIPLLFINIFIYELQVFLIPFHLILTINVFYNKFSFFNFNLYLKKKIFCIIPYFILLIPALLILNSSFTPEDARLIYNNIEDKTNVDKQPIYLIASTLYSTMLEDSKFMFSSKSTFINFILLSFISIGSIFIIFNYLKKKSFLFVKNYQNVIFCFIPMFFMFFLGRDWGRWLSLINFSLVLFFLQFQLKIDRKKFIITLREMKDKIVFMFSIILVSCYLFIIEIPHCCVGKSPIGGMIGNIKLFIEVNYFQNLDLNTKLKSY